MKKIYSLLFLSSFIFISYGQLISVRYEVGIGQYQLTELKSFQNSLKDMAGELGVKSVETFPSTLYYGLGTDFKLSGRSTAGILVHYNTTGGRNHIQDYSGEYKMDILLNSFALGANYSFLLHKFGNVSFKSSITGGVRLSTLELAEKLTIYNDNITDSDYKFDGVNYYLLPSGEFNYPLKNNLCLNLKAGYEFDLRSRYYKKDDKNLIMKNINGKDMYIDYSGLRIGLGVSYSF